MIAKMEHSRSITSEAVVSIQITLGSLCRAEKKNSDVNLQQIMTFCVQYWMQIHDFALRLKFADLAT